MNNEGDLVLPATAPIHIAAEVQSYGHIGVETGGFLLAARGTSAVSHVALAGGAGIERHRGLFQISERALDRIFTFADDHDLWIPAQFHSHELGPFLSLEDKEHGLRLDGFISIVVPNYVDPPSDIELWGWWRFESDQWPAAAAAAITDGPTEVLRFDEAGTHGA